MLVNFTKMHSLGNDFVLFDGISQIIQLRRTLVKRIADRCFGIGCNQVLVVEPPKSHDCDFFLRIYNEDGLEVEHCGNGARCMARFILKQGLSNNNVLRMECLAGRITLTVLEDNMVSIDMGVLSSKIEEIIINNYGITNLYCLNIGNPHAICIVEDFGSLNLAAIYEQLNKTAYFPQGVNLSFVSCASDKIQVRVFERGCGETNACGTAAAAIFFVLRHLNLCLEDVATIFFKHGNLQANIDQENHIHVRGPTTSVFVGCVRI